MLYHIADTSVTSAKGTDIGANVTNIEGGISWATRKTTTAENLVIGNVVAHVKYLFVL